MKRNIIVLGLISLVMFSCGEKKEEKKENKETTESAASEEEEMDDETGMMDESEIMDESAFDHSEHIGGTDYDAEKMKDWPSQIYRCDGYRPSMASEWIKVIYTPDNDFINTILYWNVNDETPIVLDLIESEYEEGEISGWTGVVKSPDGKEEWGFGMIEDRFNLTYGEEGPFQEFYAE